MSEITNGRIGAGQPVAPDAAADLGDITTAAARAVARTLAAAGPRADIVREAAERAVQAHLQKAAKSVLDAALEGDFGDALDEQVGLALDEALNGSEPDTEPEMVYDNFVDWMNGFMLGHYRRHIERGGMKWCANIWEHAEAVSRIEATWLAWEHMRHQGPTGPAVWWRDYFDPMMHELTSQTGPFHACNYSSNEHTVPERWTILKPPEGLYNGQGHPPASDPAATGTGTAGSPTR